MSQLRFDGKVALITGAGRGLGRSYAKLLGARGASIVVNDPGVGLKGDGGDNSFAQQVAAEITQDGGKAVANFDSVASEQGAQAMVDTALKAFGHLDIIINNAGNFLRGRPFEETSSETFESLWRVHVLGSINVIRAAWPHLKSQRSGRIINTSSHVGYLGVRGDLEYSTAKAAIHGLTRTLSMEAADYGISVNAVAPGALTRPVLDAYGSAEGLDDTSFAVNLVAPTVVWLAHDECRVNGEIFGVMSGTTTRIKVAETEGFRSKTPTPEAVRDNFPKILDQGVIDGSGLVFGTDGVSRGQKLADLYRQA